jgi:hypothetical protein
MFPNSVLKMNTIEEVIAENPALEHVTMRINRATKQASVDDIIDMMSRDSLHENHHIYEKFGTKMSPLKINNAGLPINVVTVDVCIDIIWDYEGDGEISKWYIRTCAHWLRILLGGDLQLAQDIERRFSAGVAEAQACSKVERKMKRRLARFELMHKEEELKVSVIKRRKLEYELDKNMLEDSRDMLKSTVLMLNDDRTWVKDVMHACWKRRFENY